MYQTTGTDGILKERGESEVRRREEVKGGDREGGEKQRGEREGGEEKMKGGEGGGKGKE